MTDINNREFQEHTERVQRLVQRVTDTLDGDARSTALELLQAVMDLHGTVVTRIVELLQGSGEPGRSVLAKLGSDPLVCGLLVLYGVHPVDLETRVARAIDAVLPRVRKQGGEVELLGVADATVRVNIKAGGSGCGNSSDALKQLVEQAVLEAAPEVVQVIGEAAGVSTSGFVPVAQLQPAPQQEKQYEESAA